MNDAKENINVLWLPGWYPSKLDFLPGDFTQRHAVATSRFARVVVLYVTKDHSLGAGKYVIDKNAVDGAINYIAYYNSVSSPTLIARLFSVLLHYRLLLKLYRRASKENGRFRLVHVHISLRQGLLALWLKWSRGLKYVITEQNSWFMPGGDKFYPNSFLLRQIIRVNFKYADAVHVVSAQLGESLKRKFDFIRTYTVIPNVVDTNIFFYKPLPALEQLHFFTITGDTWHKNTDGLIKAFSQFLKAGGKAILHVAGPDDGNLQQLCERLSIQDNIKFYGAISYQEVAEKMQQSSALIFFTRYETFGCVMAEALCCGRPVIASNIAVLQENLIGSANAVFAEPENENDLAEKLALFSATEKDFNHQQIARDAFAKYNYEKIGKEFLLLYQSVLKAG
jgi:glycosyltransferase involved in cell wall biosynthesis